MKDLSIKIAIIDDNEICRKILLQIIKEAGLSVVFEAENGKDCLLKMLLSPNLPEVLLMDIEMPEMDGFETILKVKSSWPQTKIIAHSSLIDNKSIARIINCGADIFLPKTNNPKELIKVIEQIL
jgi:DNA-binding NarL/FixJ family response regulator